MASKVVGSCKVYTTRQVNYRGTVTVRTADRRECGALIFEDEAGRQLASGQRTFVCGTGHKLVRYSKRWETPLTLRELEGLEKL